MRRFMMILVLLLLAAPVMAQDATPVAPPIVIPEALATAVAEQAQRAEAAADNAEQASDAANGRADTQLNMAAMLLDLFQSVTAVAGILLPALAIVAGWVGFNRLNSAQSELQEAREKFEKEIRAKQDELQQVREALEAKAIELQDKASRANLSSSFLIFGERQYRFQDLSGALTTYNQALELAPDSLITHYRLGYVYTQADKLEEAKHHLETALTLRDNFPPALATLGYVYRRMGEKQPEGLERDKLLNQAERYLLQALELAPKLVDEDNESWWGSLGGLYRRRGQIDQAINAYEAAAKVIPGSSYAFSNLALLYAGKKNREEMLKRYTRVELLAGAEVMAEIENYWAYADLLTAKLALGKADEAEGVLRSVLDTAPKDSPYALKSLLDTLGRLEQALMPDKHTHLRSFMDRIRQASSEASAT